MFEPLMKEETRDYRPRQGAPAARAKAADPRPPLGRRLDAAEMDAVPTRAPQPTPVTSASLAPKPEQAYAQARPSAVKVAGYPELTRLTDLLAVVDGIRPGAKPNVFVMHWNGKDVEISGAQHAALLKDVNKALGSGLRGIFARLEGAQAIHQGMEADDPEFEEAYQKADALALACASTLFKGRYQEGGYELGEAEYLARYAYHLAEGHQKRTLVVEEAVVETLQYTEQASYLTLGVLATLGTGGAAGGVLALAAPTVGKLGAAGVEQSLGQEVDWAGLGVDALVDTALVWLGGKLAKPLYQGLSKIPQLSRVGGPVLVKILRSEVLNEGSTAIHTVVRELYDGLRGQKLSWGQLEQELLARMLDPKGIVVAALFGALEAGVGGVGPAGQRPDGTSRGEPKIQINASHTDDTLASINDERENRGYLRVDSKQLKALDDVKGLDGRKNLLEYEKYLKLAESLEIATSPNGAVVWSGPGNRLLAEDFAVQNGKLTLEMTAGGKWLDEQGLFKKDSQLTNEQATRVWQRISQRFIENASGNVVGFVKGSRSSSTFGKIEYPAIIKNTKIKNLITGGY